jgi:hypothetical protein
MTLPDTPTPAITTSPNCLVLYGAPKIGKTSIVSTLPRHLLLDLEQGSSYVTATKIVVDNIFAINGVIKELQNAKDKYNYLIVDTLDALESWCEAEATRLYKDTIQGKRFTGSTVLQLPQGGGYMWLRNTFYDFFNRLRLVGSKTIFIGHLRDKQLTINDLTTTAKDGQGNDVILNVKEVTSKDLDLTGKIRNIVCSYCDAVGRVFLNSENKLTISFKTTENVNCGARPPHLSGQEFVFNKPATLADWSQIYLELKT